MMFFESRGIDLSIHQKFLKILLLIILLLGLFFRFANLDRKVVWGDESFTFLALSGNTIADVKQQSLPGKIINIQELDNRYQKINPEHDLSDTIRVLTKDVHPPLYYTLLYLWNNLLGHGVAVSRSLSAVISCLVFPSVYWLCWELFNSSLISWIGMSLISVSPFHVLYAQEARMYSLWTVTILLSSAALLRAINNKNRLNWLLYATSLAFGLYTYIFTVFVAVAHGIYIFTIEKFCLTKKTILYLLASAIGIISFTPWLITMIANKDSFQNATSWSTQSTPLLSLIHNWIYNFTYVFADFFFFFTYNPDSIFNLSFGKFIIPLVFLLIGCSLYFLIRQAPRKIWLCILSLVLVNTTGVIIPDLISGGYASIMSRYFIPCYLGIEIAVAYLLASKINSTSISIKQQRLWKAIAVTIITVGVISCTISSQSEFWWNKRTTSYDYLQASRIINQQNKPLLIAENMFATFPLTHTLNRATDLLVANTVATIEIPQYYDRVYLLQPSKQLKYQLEQQGYKLNIAYKGRKQSLWQLEKVNLN